MSTLSQRNFASGEIGPELQSRIDTTKYMTGLRTLRNATVARYGGADSRAGFQFIGEVKDSSLNVRLIPFIYDRNNSYLLEFGNHYVRFIKNGAYITETVKAITNIVIGNGSPGSTVPVITSTSHGYSNGDQVELFGIVGMTELNGRTVTVSAATANTFECLGIDGTTFTAYSSGGVAARIYTVTTTYLAADLPKMRFAQNGSVLSIGIPDHVPQMLTRNSDTSWTLSNQSYNPAVATPSGFGASVGAGSLAAWVVTAVDSLSFEESLPTSPVTSNTYPSSGSPVTLSWTAVAGAASYNVYRAINGVFGFYGRTLSTSFVDNGFGTPDVTISPPIANQGIVFGNIGALFFDVLPYVYAPAYYQQRLVYANRSGLFASRTSSYSNFATRFPLQSDDSLQFYMSGKQNVEIKHLLDLGKLIVFTSCSEVSIEGDDAGVLRPGYINPKVHSYNGCSDLRPLVIDNMAIYVQANGSIVRDLGFEFQVDGYRGNELTIFSPHLVQDHTLVDWDYQHAPNSIVWAVRDDGVLLGLTYVREQIIMGWHRHDTDGAFENACVIPENNEDVLYVVVRRTINGATKRYIERMHSRAVKASAIEDFVALDCSLSYDGRNSNPSLTMTVSGGVNWDQFESLTLTSSSAFFKATDIGNMIELSGPDGTIIRLTISAYTSSTVVTVSPQRTIPVAMRSTGISNWAKAVASVSGLWHLEGKNVSVFADGYVIANPNNPQHSNILTVTNGKLVFSKPHKVIHVGLPFTSDIETLDIDSSQGETLADKKMRVNKVTMQVNKTRGVWVGGSAPTDDSVDPLEGLTELKSRTDEGYNSPTNLQSGKVSIQIESQWNSNGRVFVRQVDPLPMSIQSVMPEGLFPFQKAGG